MLQQQVAELKNLNEQHKIRITQLKQENDLLEQQMKVKKR